MGKQTTKPGTGKLSVVENEREGGYRIIREDGYSITSLPVHFDKEEADRIVRCVNNHEALLAVAKRLVGHHYDGRCPEIAGCVQDAILAIHAVEKGEG